MAIEVTRTFVGSITNHRRVRDGLDSLGDAAAKIWNVARWTVDRIWNAIGIIPDEAPLKSYMKNHQCWKDLNAQSSQKVIEELSGAFQSGSICERATIGHIRPATANGATNDQRARSRSRKTASDTIRSTTRSD